MKYQRKKSGRLESRSPSLKVYTKCKEQKGKGKRRTVEGFTPRCPNDKNCVAGDLKHTFHVDSL